MKQTAIVILILIVLANVPPIKWLVGQDDLYYSNATGAFTYDEINYTGRNFELAMRNWQAYKSIVGKDTTTLYRITPINIFKFWRWGDYLTKEKYRLPYKSWNEIEAGWGPVRKKTNWQAF